MPTTTVPLVHNKETTVQSEPIATYGQLLRHSCLPEFNAAAAIYESIESKDGYSFLHKDEDNHKSKSYRLAACRSVAWFCRHRTTGEVRVSSNACHLRWCPICSRTRRNYISHVVGEWIGKQKYPKFLTFTIKHSDTPLEIQVERLYKAFRDIRRCKLFKEKIWGGVWFFQIKKSDTDSLWHPHLHCLVTGYYLYRKKLSRMWEQVTHDSVVVDIKSVQDPQAAANDVARYSAAPGSLSSMPLADGCELVGALHGKRICGTWGSGRALSLRPAKLTNKTDWQNIGGWFEIVEKRHSDPNAQAIINAWQDKKFLPEGILFDSCEKLIQKCQRTLWNDSVLDEVHKAERSPP